MLIKLVRRMCHAPAASSFFFAPALAKAKMHTSSAFQNHYTVQNKSDHLSSCLAESSRKRDEIQSKNSRTNGNLRKAIHDRLRLLWTYNSNAIEGSGLTLDDTRFFLEEGLTVSGKKFRDYVDARNHTNVIDTLQNVVASGTPIDTVFIREMNRLLISGQEYITGMDLAGNLTHSYVKPGEYKTEPNYVNTAAGIHEYVLPRDVAYEMTILCDWLRREDKRDHPVIEAAIAHYNKVRIHPFQDGNGRGARILMNLVLMQAGYQPCVIQVKDRARYLKTLGEADKGQLVPFSEFIAESVIETQDEILRITNQYLHENSNPNRPGM